MIRTLIFRALVALGVQGRCDRCGCRIRDFAPPHCGMTAGYYLATAFPRYANPGEDIICDECMWSDPAYIVDYGGGL